MRVASGCASNQEKMADNTDWSVVLFATFSGLAAALQIGKASASLPAIRLEFQTDLTILSVYMAIISVVAAVGGLWFGVASRRFDARPVGLIGLLIIAAGSAFSSLSDTITWLVTSRVVEALGFALVATSMPGIIQDASAERHKATTLGIWATWLPAGVAMAMLISFLVIDDLGWRGLYWICTGIVLLSALTLYLSTKGALKQKDSGVVIKIREIFTPNPLLIMGIFVVFASANMIVMGFLPTLLVDTLSYDHSTATLISFLAILIMLPANVLGGWLVDTGWDRKLMFYVSLSLMAFFALVMMHSGVDNTVRVITIFLFSIVTGIPPALIWSSIPVLAKRPGEAPLISGLLYQGSGFGQVVGPVLAGVAVQNSGNWLAAGWVITVLIASGVIFAWMLRTE